MHNIYQIMEQFIYIKSSLLSITLVSLQILLKLQAVEKILLWLEEWRKHLHAQLMETLNPGSNGTITKLEERFQVENS